MRTKQIEMLSLEDLVPQKHNYRKIKKYLILKR